MADDAGALLVRSGLVSSNALDDARARVASIGGTLGEQLVTSGAIADDDLTAFYRSRLLVPQVNPNTLARLAPAVVAAIPGDMAIELRAIPVTLDRDNNLTVAMSDPSDRHAVDEIAFFTGAYIVRAVATQMQIAWCLAHYYGHVTALGQRLLRASQGTAPIATAGSGATAASRLPRAKGLTGKVNATRHRAIAPVTGPVDVLRPSSAPLDLRALESGRSGYLPTARSGQGPAAQPPGPSGSAGAKSASPPGAAAAAGAKRAPPAGAVAASVAAAAAPAAMTGGHVARPAEASGTQRVAGAAYAPGVPAPVSPTPPQTISPSTAAGAPAGKLAGSASPTTPTANGAPTGKVASPAPPAAPPANGAPTVKLPPPATSTQAASGAAAKLAGPAGVARSAPASAPEAAAPVTTKLASSSGTGAAAPPATVTAGPPSGPTGAGGAGPRRTPATGMPVTAAPVPGATGPEPPARAGMMASAAVRPRPAGLTPPAGTRPSPPAAASASADARGAASPPPNTRASSPRAYSADDDALPTPMLDDSLSAPVLDDALPTPVLDEPSSRIASSHDLLASGDEAPDRARARSISGEIRVPVRRAASIKPPLPQGDDDGDDEPLITIERREDDATAPRALPPRRRAVKSDPPELYARAGEVDLKTGGDRAIDADEPRIVVDEDALAPPTGRIDARAANRDAGPPGTAIDVLDDADTGALIHDRGVDRESQPILLDRPRPSEQLASASGPGASGADAAAADDEEDTGEVDIVVLDAPKRPRPERRTRVGAPPAPAQARGHHDSFANGVPVVPPRGERGAEIVGDVTTVDLHPAPPGDDTTSDQLAAPPAPVSDADTNPHVVAPPPAPVPAPGTLRSGPIARALLVEDDGEDDESPSRFTSEMTAAELDDAVPQRTTDLPEHLLRRGVQYDPVDDGWGPPGTTIPPPLLGAIPGSDDDEEVSGAIPMPNVDSAPLLVGTPSLPLPGESPGQSLVRALEEATARAIDVIRQLERTQGRDEIVEMMVSYLAETHHRAGFFVTRHTQSKTVGELALFAMLPRPAAIPSATLRLDRPSTLQDVVGTRLPYRGPMHDDASRAFLVSTLGASPPEILLVPVSVRERVVGVLFGEHRLRHTFDDQLALAARAAGMALERILRSRRG